MATEQKPQQPGKQEDQGKPAPEHPVGDAELNEEAGKRGSTPRIDRSKTPGRTFDV
jgi:hypothetical protein